MYSDNWVVGDILEYSYVDEEKEKYIYLYKCGDDMVSDSFIGSELLVFRGVYENTQNIDFLITSGFLPVLSYKYYQKEAEFKHLQVGKGIVYKKGFLYRLIIDKKINNKIANKIKKIGNMSLNIDNLSELLIEVQNIDMYLASGYDIDKFKYITESNIFIKPSNRLINWLEIEDRIIPVINSWRDNYVILDS